MSERITVVGGGLAGSEAAYQAAEQGAHVLLFEMRPAHQTGAHQSGMLGELVCSNSLGSKLPDRAPGMLMAELKHMGSMLIECAEKVAVPAGGALAVDREAFARLVTERVEAHPRITLERQEVLEVPSGPAVIATGPLTSPAFSEELSRLTGQEHLYFYDALAPIVESDSINHEIAFRGSRYDRGQEEIGDYLNCPLNEQEYAHFIDALVGAERIPLRENEAELQAGVQAGPKRFFEGCLPIEVLAVRGRKSLAFGPMRPVGLRDPRTGRRPYAVVQLRQDNLRASLYNLVGFQTNLTYAEQKRVLRLIPGLENARFFRFGQMHRNTFLNAPKLLCASLQLKADPLLFFAGQITGVEGYLGNIATGLLAGLNVWRATQGSELVTLPEDTMLGALCHYIAHAEPDRFQPMKANLGLLPALGDGVRRNRRERATAYAERAHASLERALLLR